MSKSPDEIIDEIQRIRSQNNRVWMDLVRLAWKKDPDAAREITAEITANDALILSLSQDLAEVRIVRTSTATKKAALLPGGGVLHTYAVREAMALGLTPIVTDRDSSCPCAKIPGVEFWNVDCYDVDAHLCDVPRSDLVGAFCGGADTHVTVAAIHEMMGWEGCWVSRKTAETCKNKLLAKEALLRAGVPTARLTMQPPYIDKPRRGSGSRGVQRRLVAQAFSPLLAVDDRFGEELLEGPEQSVEVLLGEGSRAINIVDRHFAWVDDQPLEWGHTNPTRLPEETQKELYNLAFSAAAAVGAKVGFFKIDSILTKDGPKVLECTPRLSGGYDSQLSTPMSTGRNLLRFGLQLACGLPLDWKLLERQKTERVTVIHRPELATAL